MVGCSYLLRKIIRFKKISCLLFIITFPSYASIGPPAFFDTTLWTNHYETIEVARTLLSENHSEHVLLKSQANCAPNQPSVQQGTLIFGPVTFTREKGQPESKQIPFTVSDPTGLFLLRLINGKPDGSCRVMSASVKLNGREVFSPCQFKNKSGELICQVTPKPGENILEVKLRSASGSFITLELYRLDQNLCSILAPHTFIKKKGKPEKETLTFSLNSQFAGPYTLKLTNGDADGSHRVDSAVIKLNGNIIFDPHHFNERVGVLSKEVSLQPDNILSIELCGKPGDQLTIEITGYDNTPPSVKITSPSNGAVFNTNPISIKGTVDDLQASVTVNGIKTTVAADGSFTMEGITLQEGENSIQIIAVDSCGNQGEDQISVYLKTKPQGPALTLCAIRIVPTIAISGVENCAQQAFDTGLGGSLNGTTDETAVSVSINSVLLPDGVEIMDQGDILWGLREGTLFSANVKIPEIDGTYPFTAVALDANGGRTEATVKFIRDTVPPKLNLTSPVDGLVMNTQTITIAGTVDDPEAIVTTLWGDVPVVNGAFASQIQFPFQEGLNWIQITATDPASNSTYLPLQIIFDTIPPKITVSAPSDGISVNTSTLLVTGTVIDPNLETLTISVNNGQPQALTITGKIFSGITTPIPGQNILTFTARDKAGNTSSSTRSVLLDLDLPSVSITSPASGASVSGAINVTVEASDVTSGIGTVSLYLDNQIQSTLHQPPFNFSLDTSGLASGPHTLTARAIDKAGNQADTSISISVPEKLRIEITSPMNGATIDQSKTLIQGRIYDYMGEVGVTVNGILAEVQGENFAALVPLQLGENVFTAIATNADGIQSQTSVTINTNSQQEPIRLTAYPSSGILDSVTNTLQVSFEAEVYLPNPVTTYAWDFNGDGTAEITGIDSKVTGQYPATGLYFPKVIVTDTQGNTYTETTLVNVLSREEMDALLRSKWDAMKSKLSGGDIEGALTLFDETTKENYRELFNILTSCLPTIVQELTDINLNDYTANTAIYDIRTVRNGTEYSFQLLFTKDMNGIWRIKSF